jgi:hypothetical protein
MNPGEPLLSRDEILRIAHRDGIAAYKGLSEYQITLRLLPDGWHVDYDLDKPLTAGGGPRYVIDPVTGAILSKKYYQ